MRIIRVKNNTDQTKKFANTEIQANSYYPYPLEEFEIKYWHNSEIMNAICANPPELIINNGVEDINPTSSTSLDAWHYLTGETNFNTNDAGSLITEIRRPTCKSAIIATHNFCDPCTWYGDSVLVEDETLSDSGDGFTFNSNHVNWIDLTHRRLTNELDINSDFLVVVKVNGVEALQDIDDYAKATYEGNVYTSIRLGFRGHGIVLEFDGTKTIGEIIDEHNTTYFYQKVSTDAIDLDEVPTAGSITLLAGDYYIDYENGNVVFYTNQAGNTVTVTYHYENGSTYYVKPESNRLLEITKSEVQFTKDCKIHDDVCFGVWVYNPNDLPNKVQYQIETYRDFKDFISTGNLGQGFIPALQGFNQDVVVFPYDYASNKVMRSSQGAEVRAFLRDNVKIEGTYSSATFYVLCEEE